MARKPKVVTKKTKSGQVTRAGVPKRTTAVTANRRKSVTKKVYTKG